MQKQSKKIIKASRINCIERIPNEVLIREILGRVAESSYTDLFNLRLSCKIFNEIAEDKYVYQCVSLDRFPIVHWVPLKEKQKSFLNKCQEYGNPEMLYRQAMLDYFNRGKRRSACNHLDKAVKLDHKGAYYLACIIMIICGDPESKAFGIKYLSEFKKSNTKHVTRVCRNNLIKYLGKMWVNNPDLHRSSTCCSNPNPHQRRQMWCDDDAINECEACDADREIKMIRSTIHSYHE
ncbi:hypothetical protein CASFOL_001915 [Castilleja foliolosa]|uniref:At2g35280-like TPR domain-containing protein n=1 Tax=Castilleja foliolosa TaxID=1961234 RepID=A0ABD3EGT4_9LAMI